MFYKHILKYSPHRCLFFGEAFKAFRMLVSARIRTYIRVCVMYVQLTSLPRGGKRRAETHVNRRRRVATHGIVRRRIMLQKKKKMVF